MADLEIEENDLDVAVNEEEQPLLDEDSLNLSPMSTVEKGLALSPRRSSSLQPSLSPDSDVQVGIKNLSTKLPPHESYEGVRRWDPLATWTPEEEAALVRKTDIYLLSWICLMVRKPVHLGESEVLNSWR